VRAHFALLAISSLASAASLAAQEPVSSSDQDIVVTGSKPTKQAVARYVNSITNPVEGQVARFRDPICPASFGLPAEYNRVIEQRIREDAVRVGLPVGGDKCDANVVLIVADEPIPLVKELRRRRPQMFVGLEFRQIEDVLSTEKPVRTWQAIEPRGSDGRPLQRVRFIEFGDGPKPVGGDGAWLNPAASNSRIQQNTQADLVSSFAVISAQALYGLTLTQIADYTAMRALARTRVPPDLTGPTILSLFNEGAAPPGELTSWDLGYLRGVYLTDNGVAAHSQEAAISSVIRRQLANPGNP
jgi:hypothetical protein